MSREYAAFISYRHCPLDTAVAETVHKLIERYRVPRELRKNGQKHLGVVFRDRDELPLSSNLTEDIYEALDHSQYLIVVCTPETPKSLWVDREIQHFLEKHSRDRVLTVLAAGLPEESIPKRITHIYGADGVTVEGQIEPLCAFLVDEDRKNVLRNLRSEFLRLAAAMLNCPYDALKQRQKRYRTRKMVAICSAVAVVVLTIMGLLIRWNVDVTQKNAEISKKNEEISQKNQEIQQQYRQTQMNESKALTLLSEIMLEQGDRTGALESAYNALQGDRPYHAPAEAALITALNLYAEQEIYTYATVNQTTRVDKVVISKDGNYAVIYDKNTGVSGIDVKTEKIMWSIPELPEFTERSIITADNLQFIMIAEQKTLVIDVRTGEILQTILHENSRKNCDLRLLSPDGKTLAVAYGESPGYSAEQSRYLQDVELTVYDVATGNRKFEIALDEEICEAQFSPDGSKLFISGYDDSWKGYRFCFAVLVDCETGRSVFLETQWACASSCFLPNGELLLLGTSKGEDKTKAYIFQRFSADGELLQTFPKDSSTVLDGQILSDGEWIFSVDSDCVRIYYLKDGALVQTIHFPDTVCSIYPDAGYDISRRAAFLDDKNRLVVWCYDSNLYCYYPTAHFEPATCIYGNPEYYTDTSGAVIQVQWNKKTLYTKETDMYDIFLPPEDGQALAFTSDEESSRVFFLRMPEPGTEEQLPASVYAQKEYFTSICPDKIQPNASYDPESRMLYWEDGEGNMCSSHCPYPIEIELENIFAKIEAGLSGLMVLPDANGAPTGYALYAPDEETWKWLPYPQDQRPPRDVRVGDSKKWVAMLAYPHYLLVYDFDMEKVLYQGELPMGEASDIRFICQDRYLLLQDFTMGNTVVMDTTNWEVVTKFDISNSVYSPELGRITAAYSPDQVKLYLGELGGVVYGMVFDTQTWTQIAKIPGMLFYDVQANGIVCMNPTTGGLSVKQVYTREELLQMAEDRLGQ